MPMRSRDLWDWKGESSARDYFAWGAFLFLVKYNVDRFIATEFFNRPWYPWYYVAPPFQISPFSWERDGVFGGTLPVVSLPFAFAGFVLTLRGLRNLRWPLWLAAFFFVPLLSFLFFIFLLSSPNPRPQSESTAGTTGRWRWARTDSRLASASLAIGLTAALAIPLVIFSASVLVSYGLGLFVGLPFCMGMFATMIYSATRPRSGFECVMVSLLASLLCGGLLLVLALEGAICLIMAVPLAGFLAALGGFAGFIIQRARWATASSRRINGVAFGLLPLFMLTEAQVRRDPPLIEATSTVVVAAPADVVWRHVISFAELPPPREMIFRAGVAYPIRASIAGSGVGAVRRCEFSTGAFIEPITAWEETRRLAFDVTEQPHPMRELSPYRVISPAHLEGFFRSRRGQFLLTALPDGKTRLEGTTWYDHNIWPNRYWRVWSDFLVHRIHHRVLAHIKTEAEKPATR